MKRWYISQKIWGGPIFHFLWSCSEFLVWNVTPHHFLCRKPLLFLIPSCCGYLILLWQLQIIQMAIHLILPIIQTIPNVTQNLHYIPQCLCHLQTPRRTWGQPTAPTPLIKDLQPWEMAPPLHNKEMEQWASSPMSTHFDWAEDLAAMPIKPHVCGIFLAWKWAVSSHLEHCEGEQGNDKPHHPSLQVCEYFLIHYHHLRHMGTTINPSLLDDIPLA